MDAGLCAPCPWLLRLPHSFRTLSFEGVCLGSGEIKPHGGFGSSDWESVPCGSEHMLDRRMHPMTTQVNPRPILGKRSSLPAPTLTLPAQVAPRALSAAPPLLGPAVACAVSPGSAGRPHRKDARPECRHQNGRGLALAQHAMFCGEWGGVSGGVRWGQVGESGG